MVPVQPSNKNEKSSNGNDPIASEIQVLRDRMAQTQITAGSMEASHTLDQSSTKNTEPLAGGHIESFQQPSVHDSIQFDMSRS